MKRRHLLQAAAAAVAVPSIARAQAFPVKPIRYIVPVAAGGGNACARAIEGTATAAAAACSR